MLLINQFTFTGAPHIWNGDEVGMWGADDPDCRKPVVWDDITYEDETADFDPSKSRPDDIVRPDTAFLAFYKKLTGMRKENPVLIRGDLNFILVDDPRMVLAYSRTSDKDEVLVVTNRSDTVQTVIVPVKANNTYKRLLVPDKGSFNSTENGLELTLEPLSSTVLKKN